MDIKFKVRIVNIEKKQKAFDADKSEAFAEELLTALNYGSLSLMMSIGHRTGIFDAMKAIPPSTSKEVAKASGLNERYVREWLGAMVTAGVIDVDSTSTKYTLPAEHAAFLTRAAGADNLAVFTQYIGLLGSVEDKIVECFKKGGGVPYDDFLRFHAVMAEDSGQSVLSSLESHVLPLVPGLTDRLADGISVLKGIHRALKSNGVYLMQDIRGSSHVYNNVDHPIGTFLYTISTMHCMTVSLSQGGEGLGAMWGEEKAREYLNKAGFKSIETNQLSHDIQNNWYVIKK